MSELAAYLRPLDADECLAHLRRERVGRIALIGEHHPLVLPINYRLIEPSRTAWVVVRTRAGSTVDHVPAPAAFEIDGVDPHRQTGWSVLVQGTLREFDADLVIELAEALDPHPWITHDRERWLVLEPTRITGRELCEPEREWAFATAYL